MAESQQVNPGDLSQQPKSINIVKETVQETKSNNEKFWHLERIRKEDHSQRSRENLRELRERLLQNSEQSDETVEKLKDLSIWIHDVCNQIDTNVQTMNRNKHDSSFKTGTKKQNLSHSNVEDTKQQIPGDQTRDAIHHKQPHKEDTQRKATAEKRPILELNPPQSGQPLAISRGTQNAIKEHKDGMGSNEMTSAKKEDRPRQSRKDKVSALISGTTVPTRNVQQGLPKTTKLKHQFSVITRNNFGLKRSNTETEDDNRLTYLMEHFQSGARSRSGGRRTFADLKLENLNISREDVLATKEETEDTNDETQETIGETGETKGETGETKGETGETKGETGETKGEAEETAGYLSQLLSVFKGDTHLFPGISNLSSDADSEAETGFQEWYNFAEDQKKKGVKPRRGLGQETVLCLDTSKSMEGEKFKEMISIAWTIVDGIEHVARTRFVPENISVTTFGGDTRVVLHLTNDYSKVKDAITSLRTTKGTTPMAGGLLVAYAGIIGNYKGVTNAYGVPVAGRIILISDGQGTPDHLTQGDNVIGDTKSQMRVEHNLKVVSSDLKSRGHRVYCVPVKRAKMRLLETVSNITRGKVYKPTEFLRLVRMTQNTVAACDLIQAFPQDSLSENEENTRKLFESLYDGSVHDVGLTSFTGEREDVLDLCMFFKSIPSNQRIKVENMVKELSFLPPLGTRMRRGPGWHYPDDQDSRGPGTVFTHGRDEMVWVEWDNGHKGCYQYMNAAKREIVEVDEPRILKDQLIATGCRVKRGPDWRPELEDQDSSPGNIGTVVRVHGDGKVKVRWDNKTIADYRFGFEGNFELELCNEARSSRRQQSRDLQDTIGGGLLMELCQTLLEVIYRLNKMKSDT